MSACRNQRGCCSFTVNSVYEEVFKGIQRRGLSLKGHICRIDCGDVEDCNQLEKQPLPLRRGLLKMRKALSRPSVWFVPSGLLYLTWQFNMAPFPLQIRKANPKVTKTQQFSVWGNNTLMMWLWLSKCQQPFFITSGIKFKRVSFLGSAGRIWNSGPTSLTEQGGTLSTELIWPSSSRVGVTNCTTQHVNKAKTNWYPLEEK